MTEKELNQIHYINIELKRLEEEKLRLESMSLVKSQQITGLPGGSGGSHDKIADYAADLADTKAMIEHKIKELFMVRKKVERYIDTIDDAEMRLIVRLRAINNMRWEDIGDELGMERTTVSKKYRRFIKDSHNSHESHSTIVK